MIRVKINTKTFEIIEEEIIHEENSDYDFALNKFAEYMSEKFINKEKIYEKYKSNKVYKADKCA